MKAVDTNVVVRLLVGDDPKQSATAKSLFAAGAIWIARTVLIETVWVLERVYEFPEDRVRETLLGLISLKNVHLENKAALAAALAIPGLELADAIHLSSRPEGVSFVTFDQTFVKRAKKAGVRDIFTASS